MLRLPAIRARALTATLCATALAFVLTGTVASWRSDPDPLGTDARASRMAALPCEHAPTDPCTHVDLADGEDDHEPLRECRCGFDDVRSLCPAASRASRAVIDAAFAAPRSIPQRA